MKKRVWRISIVSAIVLCVLTGFVARPVAHLVRTLWMDRNEWGDLQPGYVNDASRLNSTKVSDIWHVPSMNSTDILHEYFVPRHRAAGFVEEMRRIIPKHRADLLNVTVRDVSEDRDSFLRYADQRMIAFVMLFVQSQTDVGEQKMKELTRDLIDAALRHEGRYYLPYRLHATPEQFHQAYPQAREFFELKRKYDPEEVFQNRFYLEYGTRR